MSEAPVAALGAALEAVLEGVLEGVSLRLGGRQVLARPQDCAMVFQAPRLLRWLTVGENLGLALAHRRGMKRAQKAQRIGQVLEVVQLAGAQALFPHELSGGIAQRVGIARALQSAIDGDEGKGHLAKAPGTAGPAGARSGLKSPPAPSRRRRWPAAIWT